MQDVSRVALMARQMDLSTAELRPELIHAGGGLLVVEVFTLANRLSSPHVRMISADSLDTYNYKE